MFTIFPCRNPSLRQIQHPFEFYGTNNDTNNDEPAAHLNTLLQILICSFI